MNHVLLRSFAPTLFIGLAFRLARIDGCIAVARQPFATAAPLTGAWRPQL